jgi:hypothetical protein
MTSQTLPHTSDDTLLRRALQGDMLFSGVSGLACIAAAGPLAALTGLPGLAILITGFIVEGYAVLLFRLTARQPALRSQAYLPIVGNVMWALASWALLLTGWIPFTPAGWWIVAIQADIVAAFAVAQYLGLRRMGHAA